MKKILILTAITAAALSSCKTSQLASYTDDVYANPAEEKKLAQLAAEEKAKAEAQEKQKREDELAAQKAKDDANPYYKDPEYNQDDYYDYQYASRVNRFQNPIYGAGYYDPYYTNLYTYNQNPMCYGTSIYSTYNYGMPSSQFNNYSIGISTGWGYNNWGYNNWGYNSFGYNYGYYNDPFYNPYGYGYGSMGYYGYGYNNWGYMNAYNLGYYNGYNTAQWGYYNSYDPNSAYSRYYGPRSSSGGGNTGRREAGDRQVMDDNGRNKYFESVAEQQNTTPRFTNTGGRVRSNPGNNTYQNSGSGSSYSNDRVSNGRNVQGQQTNNQYENNNRYNDRSTNQRQTRSEDYNNNSQNRSNNNGWNNNSDSRSYNSGGGRSSEGGGGGGRSSGGGGNSRPR